MKPSSSPGILTQEWNENEKIDNKHFINFVGWNIPSSWSWVWGPAVGLTTPRPSSQNRIWWHSKTPISKWITSKEGGIYELESQWCRIQFPLILEGRRRKLEWFRPTAPACPWARTFELVSARFGRETRDLSSAFVAKSLTTTREPSNNVSRLSDWNLNLFLDVPGVMSLISPLSPLLPAGKWSLCIRWEP